MDKVSDELREFLRTYFSVTEYVASIEAFDPTDISYVTDERVLNIIRLDEDQRGLGDYHTVRDKLYFATTLVGALLPDWSHTEDEATKIQKSKFFEDFRAAFPKPEYELFEKFTGNKVVIYRLSLVIDDGKLNNLLVSIEMKKPVPGLSPEIDLFLYENRFVLVQETSAVKVGDMEISSGFHRYSNGISTSRHYVLKNSDVRKLAAALSKHTQMEVRVCACARILARYVDGQLVGEIRSLTDFYTNLDAEEIAASSF